MKLIGIKELGGNQVETKPMSKMEPLEVCVVVGDFYDGHIVMRTASEVYFEVIDLTEILIESAKKNIKENKVIYWTDDTHWNHLGIIDTMKFISYKIIF